MLYLRWYRMAEQIAGVQVNAHLTPQVVVFQLPRGPDRPTAPCAVDHEARGTEGRTKVPNGPLYLYGLGDVCHQRDCASSFRGDLLREGRQPGLAPCGQSQSSPSFSKALGDLSSYPSAGTDHEGRLAPDRSALHYRSLRPRPRTPKRLAYVSSPEQGISSERPCPCSASRCTAPVLGSQGGNRADTP